MARHFYLVSYDIADDKRRNKVFDALRDNGDHVQYSVFLCQLSKKELWQLKSMLEPVVHHQEDQVIFLDLGQNEVSLTRSMTCMGKHYVPPTRVRIV
jgi:CRISPR-associated protein Cas2